MMKTKHYIYARLITALLSTTTIAGSALTDTHDVTKSLKASLSHLGKGPIDNSDFMVNENQKAQLLSQSDCENSLEDDFIKVTTTQKDVDAFERAERREKKAVLARQVEKTKLKLTGSKIAGYSYDEVLDYAKLAKYAYTDLKSRAKLYKEYQSKGYQITHFGTSREDSGFILAKGKDVIVSYRGTASYRDLGVDLYGVMNTSSFTQGRFHSGFYNEFKESWDEAYSVIHAHAKTNNLDVKDLNLKFTGHSLGGGLAGIAATRWAEMINADNVSLITMAAPKFCDTVAARNIEKLFGDRILRVTQHGFDIVPGVGPGIMGYEAVGHNLRLKAENWSDMHVMGAYERLLKTITPTEFKHDSSVRSLYIGGMFNPLNMFDGVIKYAVNEYVVGNVQYGISAFSKRFFGRSVAIEKALEIDDLAAAETKKKHRIRSIERNLTALYVDKEELVQNKKKYKTKSAKSYLVKMSTISNEINNLNKQLQALTEQ